MSVIRWPPVLRCRHYTFNVCLKQATLKSECLSKGSVRTQRKKCEQGEIPKIITRLARSSARELVDFPTPGRSNASSERGISG